MANPFATQRDKYKHTVPGEALFFSHGTHRALRLEAESIGVEFADSTWLGSDPEGILSYNDLNVFHVGDPKKPATYVIDQVTYKNAPCAHIIFHHGDPTRPFAEFLAEDPTNAAGRNGMIGYGATGFWNKLNLGSATATVYKDSDSNSVTLTAPSIHKTATWSVAGSAVAPEDVDVQGTVYFKDLTTVTNGLIANYSSDRVVFYNSVHSYDFVAYFIPFEDGGVGGQSLKLATDTEFLNVAWGAV